jgi:D-lactate dehydrogenase (cytochrome)
MFIGAEGTLGIITEVTIYLAPVIPTMVATIQFPNMYKASKAIIEILNTGISIYMSLYFSLLKLNFFQLNLLQ